MFRLILLASLLTLNISCQNIGSVPPTAQSLQRQLFILQGATDTTSAQIHVLAPAKKTFTFQLKMESSTLEAPQPFAQEVTGTSWQLVQLQLKDLTSDLLYTLQVFDEDRKLVDERFFRVLSKKIKKPRIFVNLPFTFFPIIFLLLEM